MNLSDDGGVHLSPLGTLPEEFAFSNIEEEELLDDEDSDVQLTPLETGDTYAPPEVYATPTGDQETQGLIDSDEDMEEVTDSDEDFYTDDDCDEHLHE